MPIENRSSNTEMAAKLSPCPYCGQQDASVEQLDSDASVVICQGRIDEHSACLARGPVGVQQHECEDQPGYDQAVKEWNKRAVAQYQPDPIAWMVGTAFWWTKEEAERDAAATGLPIVGLGPMAGAVLAEQHQGEPVTLPARKDPTQGWAVPGGVAKADGWNACLDEIAKLGPLYKRPVHGEPVWFMTEGGLSVLHAKAKAVSDQQGLDTSSYSIPLYTYADPDEIKRLVAANSEYARRHIEQIGEVERLRKACEAEFHSVETLNEANQKLQAEVERLQRRAQNADLALKAQTQNCDTLRAQLAEAQALLREAACHAIRMEPMSASCLNRIDTALDRKS